MLLKDQAVCISAVDYSETSQIVTFFTKVNGKIGAIAKGSKRPKSASDGPLEILSSGQIVFSHPRDRKLATLTEFQQHTQPNFRTAGLYTINCASFAAELVNHTTDEYDPHPELFDSFLGFLQNAEDSRNNSHTLALLILFQLTLLKEVGLQPVLNRCANCKMRYEVPDTAVRYPVKKYKTYFSNSANGLICRDCESTFPDRIQITTKAANCLSNLKLIAEAKEKTLNEIEKILVRHFTATLHKTPRMAKYILK